MAGVKQHYVPQFLLRNFAIGGDGRQISAFRFAEGKHLPRTAIKEQAHENHFYGSARVEDMFAGLEGDASCVIDRAVRSEEFPTYGSKSHEALLLFALFQVFRTRAAADETNAMTDTISKRMMRDVPEIKDHLDHIEVKVTNAPLYTLHHSVASFDLTRDLRCKLLCNRTGTPFIISDNPAVLYNQFLETRKKTGSNTGLAVKGLQLFLPIGPNHQLLFFDADVYTVGGRRLKSLRVDVEAVADVRAMNLLQAANAASSLYFNDGIPPREVEALARKATKYRPGEKAVLLEYEPVSGDQRRDGTLVRMFTPDVRTHLSLGVVRLTPQAERYDMGDRLIHHRNPELCALHKQFMAKVRAGTYRVGQFGTFLKDAAEGR